MSHDLSQPKSLEDWYWQARECSTDRARRDLISELRSSDAAAAEMLKKMLEADQHAHSFMDLGEAGGRSMPNNFAETCESQPAVRDSLLSVPKQIGPYKLLEPIGEGGMGVVYLAQQSEPVRRKVALKIIKPGMDSRQVIARFEAERQALAMMEHPNIAKVLDAGTTDSGLPYFVMELVRGIPMTEYCDQAKMPTRQRLELFADACAAIQHAHNKGIIHRDIKPSNVLVTEHDGTPVVKVIDFGVAKALTDNLTDKTLFTGMFQMIGTPLYMSPEQASLSNLDVDVRSDVYSLGVMLYELVSGTLPIDRETAKKLSLEQLRRHICDTEPPRPSKRLSTLKEERETIAENRGVDIKRFHRLVSNELDWIAMKAIEKDRKRRYQSARQLAEDVQRYLEGEAVEACPPSLSYRANRYARRHRWLIATVSAVLLTALVGSAVALRYAFHANQSEQDALTAQRSAEDLAHDYKSLMLTASANADAANQSAAEAQRARETANQQSNRARRARYVSDIRLAAAQIDQGLHAESLEILARHVGEDGDDDLRGYEWYYLLGEANQSSLAWEASPHKVSGVDWSSDGELIATASGRSCKVWNSSTGELREMWNLGRTTAGKVRWSEDSRFLAWGTASDEAKVRIWDRKHNKLSKLPDFPGSVWSIHWNQDATQMCVGSITYDNGEGSPDVPTVHLYKRDSIESTEWKRTAFDAVEGNVRLVDWNADETRIWAINSASGAVRLYDAEQLDRKEHQVQNLSGGSKVCDGALANQTERFAITSFNGTCVVLNERTQSEVARYQSHWSEARACWSPNDRWLATCGFDGFVKIWDASDWTLHQTFSGHQGIVCRVAWSPDGEKIASCGADGQVIVWNVDESPKQAIHSVPGAGESPRFAWLDNERIQYIRDKNLLAEIDVHSGIIRKATPIDDGDGNWQLVGKEIAISLSQDNQIVGCTNVGLRGTINGRKATAVDAMIAEGTAKIVISPGYRTRPLIFDTALNLRPIKVGSGHFVSCEQLRWSPQGRYIAIAGQGLQSDKNGNVAEGGWLHLIDATNGKLLNRVSVGFTRITASSVAWSPDEEFLVAGGSDGFCAVYDRKRLSPLCTKAKHRASVYSLDFHPGGLRIASAGDDQSVLIWDVASGETLLSFSVGSSVKHAAWSPDGTKLAALTAADELYIWDSRHGHEFSQTSGFLSRVESVVEAELDDAVNAQNWGAASQIADQ